MPAKVADIPRLLMRGHRMRSSFVKVGKRFINMDHVGHVSPDQTGLLTVSMSAGNPALLLSGEEAESLLKHLQERVGAVPTPRQGDVMDMEHGDAAVKSAQDGIALVQRENASSRR
jgi:hypothetical protein